MIQITGLWCPKNPNSKILASGMYGNAKWIVMPNKKKKHGSNQPDFYLMIAENEKKQEEIAVKQAMKEQKIEDFNPEPVFNSDEEIPF